MFGIFHRLARVLREYNATLDGWRFDDVKKHIDAKLTNSGVSPIAENHSLNIAASNKTKNRQARIAFITNLPPEDTGIATCSMHSWLSYRKPLDIFCPVVDVDWFLTNSARFMTVTDEQISVYDKSVFMAIASQQDYEAIIIAIGNSTHCFYIHDLLKKIEAIGATSKVLLYVHDPCLLHMIQRGSGIANSQFSRFIKRVYDMPDGVEIDDYRPDWELWNQLIPRGVFGLRYFASLGVKGFLFNSRAAIDMADRDLGSLDVLKAQLFHPVFAVDKAPPLPAAKGLAAGEKRAFSVGTFGVPNGSKCSIEIVDAVTLLRKRGHKVRLLIAGYQANLFLAQHRDALTHDDTEVFDGPTDRQLLSAMQTVDVAVQLRRHNLGESSGVVPMLLQAGIPTIVSALGAFKEFGAAVHQLAPDASPTQIADAILATLASPPSPDVVSDYVRGHSAEAFQQRVEVVVDEWTRFRESRGLT